MRLQSATKSDQARLALCRDLLPLPPDLKGRAAAVDAGRASAAAGCCSAADSLGRAATTACICSLLMFLARPVLPLLCVLVLAGLPSGVSAILELMARLWLTAAAARADFPCMPYTATVRQQLT